MGSARAALVAALAGFSVMSLELTAVRLLAPHFGNSTYVWTNVIGVILLALAAGAWWGGRLADQQRGARRLSVIFLVAGVLVTAVPLVSRSLGGWLLPQDLPLDAAMPALVRGSLAASLILFAPAVGLLGCVTPMLITVLAAQRGVGRASGLVAATSTVGSLLGTFATTHVLVPELGSRLTVWLGAALLLVCSLLCRPVRSAAALLLLPALLAPLPWGPMRLPPPPDRLLAEVESRYQFLQVVRGSEDERVTSLKINEGLDSFHSVAIEGSAYTGGRYYDYHAVVPFLAGDGSRPAPLRVLSLGDAAGSFNRLFAHAWPGCTVDAVEIDRAVVRLGEEFFGGRRAAGRTYADLDARVFVERASETYEVILLDAYEHQVYIPAHVASVEFFAALQRRLVDRGVVSVNVGGLDFEDPVVVTVARTMAGVFGESWAYRIPYSRNFIVAARRGARLDPSVLATVEVGDPELQRIVDRTAAMQAWRSFRPGAPLLVDDRPLLDELLDRAGYAGRSAELTGIHGQRDPAEVIAEATALLNADNPLGALAAIGTARRADGHLRILAGNARWSVGDLRGALAEYRAAGDAGVEGELRRYLDGQREACEAAVSSRDRAASVASRNGWLAAGLFIALSLAAWAGLRRA